MRALDRSTVVVGDTGADLAGHAIGIPHAWVLGHTIVCAVESHVGNTLVTLDASRLLESSGDVWVNLSEDGDLALENLLVGADLHLAGNIVDEAVLCAIIEDLLPQSTWGVEVLWSNLRQECDRLASKVAVSLVEVNYSLTKGDGVDRAEVILTSTLVVEGHAAITLEVAVLEASAWSVDWELLVVHANSVAVSIWIGEQTRLETGSADGSTPGGMCDGLNATCSISAK